AGSNRSCVIERASNNRSGGYPGAPTHQCICHARCVMRTPGPMVVATIVLILGAIVSGDDKLRLPSTAPPVQVIAQLDQEGRVVLRVPVPEYQLKEPKVQKEGKEQTVLSYAPVVHEEVYRLSGEDVKVLGTDGKPTERQALPELLKKEVPALYAV